MKIFKMTVASVAVMLMVTGCGKGEDKVEEQEAQGSQNNPAGLTAGCLMRKPIDGSLFAHRTKLTFKNVTTDIGIDDSTPKDQGAKSGLSLSIHQIRYYSTVTDYTGVAISDGKQSVGFSEVYEGSFSFSNESGEVSGRRVDQFKVASDSGYPTTVKLVSEPNYLVGVTLTYPVVKNHRLTGETKTVCVTSMEFDQAQ